jgi:hypothetical protein
MSMIYDGKPWLRSYDDDVEAEIEIPITGSSDYSGNVTRLPACKLLSTPKVESFMDAPRSGAAPFPADGIKDLESVVGEDNLVEV